MLRLKSQKIELPEFSEVLAYIEPLINKWLSTYAPSSPREHKEEMAQEARLHAWITYNKINQGTWKRFIHLRVRGAIIDYIRQHKGVRSQFGTESISYLSFDKDPLDDALMGEITAEKCKGIDYELLTKAMIGSEEVFLTVKAAIGFTRDELSAISGLPVNSIDAAIARVKRKISSGLYYPDSPVGLLVKALKPESTPHVWDLSDQFDIKDRIKNLLHLFQEH